jgi:predicted PurR-regulated permease PerM
MGDMIMNRIVEYVFFFGFMAVVGYLLSMMLAPFISALALSAIIVTICYPLYERILKRTPKRNETFAALTTTLLVLCIFIIPLFFLTSILINEALSIYTVVNLEQVGFEHSLHSIESNIQLFIPGFDMQVTEYLKQGASWLASHLGAFFAGTASTIFLIFIAIIGSFYLFRDGREFTKSLVRISPLPDAQDEVIMDRLAKAVRSVATGTVLIAIIQGILTAFGLWLFGFDRAVLWGLCAAFGALVPGVGTMIVFVPAVAYLAFQGMYMHMIGVGIWGTVAVGLIDNFLGPYLMSRGNSMHPFLILLAVLGGIAAFGPIGFIVGPVLMSLFKVLLELYSVHISDQKHKVK